MTLFISFVLLILGTLGILKWVKNDHRILAQIEKLEQSHLDKPATWKNYVLAMYECDFCLIHNVALLALLLWFLVPFGYLVVIMFAVVYTALMIKRFIDGDDNVPG